MSAKVATASGWACLAPGCLEHGEGVDSDKQAEKHGQAFTHATVAWTRPVGADAPHV